MSGVVGTCYVLLYEHYWDLGFLLKVSSPDGLACQKAGEVDHLTFHSSLYEIHSYMNRILLLFIIN